MPRVAHVVVSNGFAGAERYVCNVANETARRGWDASVVGGQPARMQEALVEGVRWLPGGRLDQALRSLARVGRLDVCHAHMSYAETVALVLRRVNRAPVLSTRHFAATRGKTRAGRLLAPWISANLTREIAVSHFVAQHLEHPPDAVVENGVPPAPLLWHAGGRAVLVMHRLEPEKDTLTALRAWEASGLAKEGWTLRIVGAGSERTALEAWVKASSVNQVTFVGWTPSVGDELRQAGMFLATAPSEPFGLSVVEAMAAGVPVVAAAGGGHLETVALLPDARLFDPGDPAAAAAALRSLTDDELRASASASERALAETTFTIARHVDRLLVEYELAQAGNGRR